MTMKLARKRGMSFIVLFSLALMVFSSSSSGAKVQSYYPQGTPTRAIQDLDDMLDDFIVKKKGEKLTPDEEEFNRNLKQKIIKGTFDIRELAKLSLSKHWPQRTKEEQDEFVQILTDLLEEKALFSKEQSAAKSKSGGKYFVRYNGHKFMNKQGDRAFVSTRVVVPSENITITLNYKMKKAGNIWMIFDIIVEEASLVDNYRYQFNNIITKHGYPDLVRRMKDKLNDLKGKRKADVASPAPGNGGAKVK